jgi:RNA polymerase sigma-70 factor, ECF subfamily
MANDDVSGLISRVALRDRPAFDRLYQSTSSKLFGVCLRILRERAEAEDALQEIYVKVWGRAERFAASDASPVSWLTAIARNHCIDRIRARKAPSVSIDDALEIADTGMDPEAHAVNRGEGARIDRCMGELDEQRAQAVRAAYVEGHSYEDLARRFNVPLNTMRTWLRRSLLKLKECLEK